MKISLKGYGENAATFRTSGLVCQGEPVTMAENFTVKPCEEEDSIIGCVLNSKDGYASVQLAGYVQFALTGGLIPTVGVCGFVADGNGGVCVSSEGRQFVVTDVDTVNNKVGFIL